MTSLQSEKLMGKIAREEKEREGTVVKGGNQISFVDRHLMKEHHAQKSHDNENMSAKKEQRESSVRSGVVDQREQHSLKLKAMELEEKEAREQSERDRTRQVGGAVDKGELHLKKQRDLEKEAQLEKKKAKEERTKRSGGEGGISTNYLQEMEKQRMQKEKAGQKLGIKSIDSTIGEKWKKIRSGESEDNFVLVGYKDGGLVFTGCGCGAPSWFLDDDDFKTRPLFVAIRVRGQCEGRRGEWDGEKILKFALILWVPKDTPFLTRTKLAYHKRKVEKLFKPYQLFFQFGDDAHESLEEALQALDTKIVTKMDEGSCMQRVKWSFD